ncbi:MAG: hypothetical protein ABJC09_13855 [Terriglobia bacterium]
MFVAMNLTAQLILFAINASLFVRCEMAVMIFPAIADLVVHSRFLPLKPSGFTRRQLPARDALTNAILLIFSSLIHRFGAKRASESQSHCQGTDGKASHVKSPVLINAAAGPLLCVQKLKLPSWTGAFAGK